jgi:hypothetical protein
VNPTFTGRGSKIAHPDILPIFWGPNWPGSGDLTVLNIMNALRSMADGPYLLGLTQYGYVGPSQIRVAAFDNSMPNIPFPALAPGVSQTPAVNTAVRNFIGNLLEHDGIENVDDNHELIVIVFLDPSIPVPRQMDIVGNITSVSGANSSIEEFEFLDDNTRFEWAWINTANGLSAATRTLSHELVESITDPFNNGWTQTSPPPGPNGGQIGDVCNQSAVVNGAAVVAYWSGADSACIVPTAGTRRASLSWSLDTHEPHDGPQLQAYINLGSPLCATGFFNYVERTYRNELTVRATVVGFESPTMQWSINGRPVHILYGSIDVEGGVEIPDARLGQRDAVGHLSTFSSGSRATELKISVGPGGANAFLQVQLIVTEDFDVAAAGGNLSSKRSAIQEIDVKSQEIVWGPEYTRAKRQCEHLQHLADGPAVMIGPPRPGDPPDLVDIVSRAIRDRSSKRRESLTMAAELLGPSRTELANDLMALAQREG